MEYVRWQKAFDKYDEDKSGTIEPDEFQNAMKAASLNIPDDAVKHIFEEADTNNDGKIDFPEFVNMARTYKARRSIKAAMIDGQFGALFINDYLFPDTAAAKKRRAESAAKFTAEQAQNIGRGRYEFLGSFVREMGPLDSGYDMNKPAPKKLTAREIRKAQESAGAVKGVAASMALGTLGCVAIGIVGWQVVKWKMGVRSLTDFSDKMKEEGKGRADTIKDSKLGHALDDLHHKAEDNIKESKEFDSFQKGFKKGALAKD